MSKTNRFFSIISKVYCKIIDIEAHFRVIEGNDVIEAHFRIIEGNDVIETYFGITQC